MGEAAYSEAKAKGELIQQWLRRQAAKYRGRISRDLDLQSRAMHEIADQFDDAANTIEWLSKERDALIEQAKHADECWRAQCDENERLEAELAATVSRLGGLQDAVSAWLRRDGTGSYPDDDGEYFRAALDDSRAVEGQEPECRFQCELGYEHHCLATDDGWLCTRKRGHDGQHMACSKPSGHTFHRWEHKQESADAGTGLEGKESHRQSLRDELTGVTDAHRGTDAEQHGTDDER